MNLWPLRYSCFLAGVSTTTCLQEQGGLVPGWRRQLLMGSINWIEVFATLLAFAGDVVPIEPPSLPALPSLWLVGLFGLIVVPVATFVVQQIVGSVITGETWNLWQRTVRARPSLDTATIPTADLDALIRQSERAVALIEGLRDENQHLLDLLVGPRSKRPIRAERLPTQGRKRALQSMRRVTRSGRRPSKR